MSGHSIVSRMNQEVGQTPPLPYCMTLVVIFTVNQLRPRLNLIIVKQSINTTYIIYILGRFNLAFLFLPPCRTSVLLRNPSPKAADYNRPVLNHLIMKALLNDANHRILGRRTRTRTLPWLARPIHQHNNNRVHHQLFRPPPFISSSGWLQTYQQSDCTRKGETTWNKPGNDRWLSERRFAMIDRGKAHLKLDVAPYHRRLQGRIAGMRMLHGRADNRRRRRPDVTARVKQAMGPS
ncbi:hypothetical protein L249_8562 [Ophiocordyceps polyrhachis-furcata BCC 54312]|uniref:Uncharacterized protein n=1 Tax=Ophiocordyceps polyrhachis-furcata BCC 54312 TaxID=1330021 RepID=A0A367L6N8_9HYPO|nr:hypothetical protein L249_8562 [Ophiocordyceps polyrhachis-furcata BCC 54312]